MRRKSLILFVILSIFISQTPSSTYATFPGQNGKINAVTSDCAPSNPVSSQHLFNNDLSSPSPIDFVTGDGDSPLNKRLSWSPDGNRFVFYSVFQFYVGIANSDGSSINGPGWSKKMGVYPVTANTITWSPDNLTIALGGYGSLYSYRFGDNNDSYPQPLAGSYDGFQDITWSPKGDLIAFIKERTGEPLHDQIGIIQPMGTTPILIAKTPSNSDDQQPDWSPDGKKIVFASNRHQVETTNYQIYTMNDNGSDVTRLTDNPPYTYSNPVWSPDGNSILALRSGGSRQALVLLDTNTGTELTVYESLCDAPFQYLGWQPLGSPKVYRLANWKTKERLFTVNRSEAISIPNSLSGWILEGTAFQTYNSDQSEITPIYRLANWKTKERLFTTSSYERDYAIAHYEGWVSEGTAFYAKVTPGSGLIPVYRLANWKTHERLFTTDPHERDHAVANLDGWVSEGIAFYVPSD